MRMINALFDPSAVDRQAEVDAFCPSSIPIRLVPNLHLFAFLPLIPSSSSAPRN